MFDALRDYRLLQGSHEFPGEDGGACLNEVAIVAAGFDYRRIVKASDCPPCFSRPIAAYVIGLNDAMPDDVRQRLKAFVLRLAGSADKRAMEEARAAYIAERTVSTILPFALRAVGLDEEAARCDAVRSLAAAAAAANVANVASEALTAHLLRKWRKGPTSPLCAERAALATQYALAAAAAAARTATRTTLAIDATAMVAAAVEENEITAVWGATVDILDGALGIGRQAPDLDETIATQRIAAALAPHGRAGAAPEAVPA